MSKARVAATGLAIVALVTIGIAVGDAPSAFAAANFRR
jgi:hypothetical protein